MRTQAPVAALTHPGGASWQCTAKGWKLPPQCQQFTDAQFGSIVLFDWQNGQAVVTILGLRPHTAATNTNIKLILGRIVVNSPSRLWPKSQRESLRRVCMGLVAELNRQRGIGAEFECAVPIIGSGDGRAVQDAIAAVLNANGIRACSRGYQNTPLPPNCDVAVEFDSSIQGEQRYQGVRWSSVEVKTRILNGVDDWERVVPPMLEIVRYCGGRVTPSTGHHIHLGFDEIKQDPSVVRSLWNLTHRFDRVIFGLVAPSRSGNYHCQAMPPAPKILHGANSIRTLKQRLTLFSRYQALNLTHIFEPAPHLEFRHHHGTLNATKARFWLFFALALVQHAVTRSCHAAPEPLPNDRKSLEALLITIGLKINTRVYSKVSPELRDTGRYLLKTWKRFNGNHPLRKRSPGQEPPCAP